MQMFTKSFDKYLLYDFSFQQSTKAVWLTRNLQHLFIQPVPSLSHSCLYSQPEKNDQLQAALLEEYGRGLDAANDKLFWSKVSGEMSGDQQFVMPSLKMAAKHAGKEPLKEFWSFNFSFVKAPESSVE